MRSYDIIYNNMCIYIYKYVIHNMSMQATTYYIVILVVPSYSVLNDFGKKHLGTLVVQKGEMSTIPSAGYLRHSWRCCDLYTWVVSENWPSQK